MSPHQQNQSGLQAEHLALPSRNSEYKHFRSYPKVSTSAQQDVGRSSGCISFTSAGWFRVWTILPTAMQANPCLLKQTLTKCANCVQSGKNNSTTMQAIQSLILPQTMSPDDSSLPVQAGFTRAFSIASLYHFLSPFCLCSLPLRFPPSSLRLPIFTIWLAVLRVSFWWDVWYFEAAGWRRRVCIGWILVV